MARKRLISIGALNIAMHSPHSPEKYSSLILDAFKIRQRIKLSNVHYAMIGYANLNEQDNEYQTISGEFFRFVKIDQNEPWFNDLTNEPATEEEKDKINIPEHLLPNLQHIPFIFIPKQHRLYVVTKDRKDIFGIRSVKKVLDSIFDYLIKTKNYPEITITILPTEDSVERILSIPNIDKLTIELVRPNADDDYELEQQLMRRMENQNASKFTYDITSAKNHNLAPDNETKKLAYVASRNGKVTASGYNEQGIKIKESTDQIPHIKHIQMNPDIETTKDVLNRVANNWE